MKHTALLVLCTALVACGDDETTPRNVLCPLVVLEGDGTIDAQVAQVQTKLFTRGGEPPLVTNDTDLFAERTDVTHLPASLEVCGGDSSPRNVFARFYATAVDGGLMAASATMLTIDLDSEATLTTQVTPAGLTAADIEDAGARATYVQSTLSRLCWSGVIADGAEIVQDQCRRGVAHLYDRREYQGIDGDRLTQLRVAGTNLCVAIPDGSDDLRAHAALSECSNAPADNAREQLIIMEPGPAGLRLRMLHSLQCLNVDNSSLSAGAAIQQFTCGDFNNQDFALAWSPSAFP